MRWLIAGLALALTIAAAQAQLSPQQTQMNGASRLGQGAAKQGADSDKNKPKANDKAYNAALRNLPDKQYDPWHGVR
jgi:long-subunit fatty acid transport protein